MHAYHEAYLEEIVETQGELFDEITMFSPGIDVKNFIQAYMKSATRNSIDWAQAYVCTMNAKELWDYFLKTEKFKPRKGEDIGGFKPNWVGQFYAYFQWYYNISSKEVVQLVPLEFIMSAYGGLHDLELDLAVKKVGEGIGINENRMFS